MEHGELIKERRLDLGLNRPAFVSEMEKHGQEITPDYLNKLERGTASLSRASLEVREAIRAVLGYSAEEWQELTGLYSPEATPQRRGGPPIPPVVPFRETPITIPRELLEMVEQYGDTWPVLKTEKMQRMLAAPRNFGGAEVGPQTAEDWLDYWMANKRFLT
ncbi:XRE family transcriptional regulator [Deinococcus hopiensis]|uniref:XRE family transcriptional regulator n=1 Tax=Deinococcus hopiensis TaxID=309885 RepID=UPI001FE98F7D|nr:XRE family transcriptional regulator [Deinococcus hopiensis]